MREFEALNLIQDSQRKSDHDLSRKNRQKRQKIEKNPKISEEFSEKIPKNRNCRAVGSAQPERMRGLMQYFAARNSPQFLGAKLIRAILAECSALGRANERPGKLEKCRRNPNLKLRRNF